MCPRIYCRLHVFLIFQVEKKSCQQACYQQRLNKQDHNHSDRWLVTNVVEFAQTPEYLRINHEKYTNGRFIPYACLYLASFGVCFGVLVDQTPDIWRIVALKVDLSCEFVASRGLKSHVAADCGTGKLPDTAYLQCISCLQCIF